MATKTKKWSGKVTATSDAMDVAAGTFKQRSARKIAEAVEHDAEKSPRKKKSSYGSAMSMLTFYINRAGKNLSAKQRETLEEAKEILRAEFGPDAAASKRAQTVKKAPAAKERTATAAKKKAAKKTTARRSARA